MKAHSIQFKFLITVISAVLAITVSVGGLSIYEVDRFIQSQTEDYIDAACKKEAMQINDIFGDMEKSVRIMESYVLDMVKDNPDMKNKDIQNEIIDHAEGMFRDVAKHTNGAVAYYLRINPEISDEKTGFFYSKPDGSNKYIKLEATDLALYDKKDREHVGWFWEPYEAGEAVWMMPYHNQNNDIWMVSYVVPLYCESQFIGVIGMDFDYTVLIDRVHEIKIYENGFAHLEMDDMIIHHDNYQSGTDVSNLSEGYLQVSEELANGMNLVLSASYDDLKQIRYDIAYKILFVMLLLVAVFSFIVFLVVRRIVDPLKKLTEASKKLSNGDYDVEIVDSNTYEIKLLSTAFENMTEHLREHEKRQRMLAYRDSPTGLRNTTAYNEWVTDFDKDISGKSMDFGALVLDLNYLKETNDMYGHDAGNKLIIGAARLISDTFKRSPVFRIGGDEFLVILQNRDLKDCEELFGSFDLDCANTVIETEEESIALSIAKGFAKYDPAIDKQFVDVFNRADEEMYKNKRKMKAGERSESCLMKRV